MSRARQKTVHTPSAVRQGDRCSISCGFLLIVVAESHFFAFLKGGGRLTEPKIILDQDGIRRALTRIAFEIVE